MKTAQAIYGFVPATAMLAMACDAERASDPTQLEAVETPQLLKAADAPQLESHIQTVPFTTFEDDVGDAGQDETIRVITSAFRYQQLFGNAPPADLQFDQEWVLFYSGGLQSTGGFEASIDSLLHVPSYDLLHADARLTEPGQQCLVPQVITKPHVLARFPIPSPRPYYFSSDITHEVVDCEQTPPIELDFDFTDGAQQWSAHFADLPQDFDPDLYQLTGEISALPSELGSGTGFLLGGSNRSDDLWMGLERQLGPDQGIEPGQTYALDYEIRFGSNAATGCIGIGGAPGEDVTQKAGGASIDPEPTVVSGDTFLRLNIDKGNQSNGGTNASVVGDIANGIPCEEADGSYVSLNRTHEHPDLVTADADGNLWLVVGTDSGFEGRTELYYQSINVTLTPL